MAHKNNISSSRKINEKFLTLKERIDDFIKEILSEEALNTKPKVTCKGCKYSYQVVEVGKTEKIRRCGLFQALGCVASGGLYVNDWNFCSWGEPVEKEGQ